MSWSRRKSQSTPLARRLAPDKPYCNATSRGMTPMPRVRDWKISFPNNNVSISSQKLRNFFITTLVSSIQPAGKSSLRPPMRSKFGWKRPPVADSMRFSTYSRSRKAKNTGVMAPNCTPKSPRNKETLAIRDSSNKMVRIHCARGGASTPINFSAAKMNGTSLAKLPSQSMRLTSVVTCGNVRTSVSFS